MREKPKPRKNRDMEEKYEIDSLDYDPDEINIASMEPTIEQLLRRIDEEALDLAPDFQRHADLWDNDTKSRLIESIIIRLPLPPFYVDATNEEKWLVVDGLQRLTAIKQFFSDKTLKLSGLEYLKEIEGKTYDQIIRKYQRRIEETQVNVYLIKKGTPPEVKFNIFKRINTGGLPLTSQEIRHALNSGKATRTLAKIAKYQEFKRVTKISKRLTDRMYDRELILGFFAFRLFDDKADRNYDSREDFLNKAMARINDSSDDEIASLEKEFVNSMITAWEIFNEYAFRKIVPDSYYPLICQQKNPLNKALFESWSINLSHLNEKEIENLKKRKKELIYKFSRLINGHEKDRDFLNAISGLKNYSGSFNNVKYRFEVIKRLIKEVLSHD